MWVKCVKSAQSPGFNLDGVAALLKLDEAHMRRRAGD